MSEYVPNPYSVDTRTSQAQNSAAFREGSLNSLYLPAQAMAQYLPSNSPSPDPRHSYNLPNTHLPQANPLGVYGFHTPTMFPSATVHYGDQLLTGGDKSTPFTMAGSQSVLPGIHNLYSHSSSLHSKAASGIRGFGDQTAAQQGLLRGADSLLETRQQRTPNSQSLQESSLAGGSQSQGQHSFDSRDLASSYRADRTLGGNLPSFGDQVHNNRLSSHYGMNVSTSGSTVSGSGSPVSSSASMQGTSSSAMAAYQQASLLSQQQQNITQPSTLPESARQGLARDVSSSLYSQPHSATASLTSGSLDIDVGSLTSTKPRGQEPGKLEKIRAHAAQSHRSQPDMADSGDGNTGPQQATGGYLYSKQSLKRQTNSDRSSSRGHEKKMRLWQQGGGVPTQGEGVGVNGGGSLPSMESLAKGVAKDNSQLAGSTSSGTGVTSGVGAVPPGSIPRAGTVKQEPISSPPPPVTASGSTTPEKLGNSNAEDGNLVPKYDPDVSAMRVESGSGRYICSHCQQKFGFTESLQIHIGRDHSGLKLQSCLACHKIYDSHERLQAHLKVHTEKCPYKCKLCGKSFSMPAQLKQHMRSHNPDGRFHCAPCRIQFMSQKCWEEHMNKHNPEGSDRSASNSNCSQEMTPSGDQNFHCGVCGDHFSEMDALQDHMKAHLEEQAHECRQCGEKFSDAMQLKDHKRVHNGGSSKKIHHCPQCQKTFTVPGSLSRHMLIHTDRKPFECKECGKQFRSSSNLQSHAVIHSGTKDHKCTNCLKAFSRPDSLLRHMRTHTGNKPHACEICSKSFAERNHLVNHLRTHTGDRPYACPNCRKTFSRSDSLNRHVLTHSEKKPRKKPSKGAKQEETAREPPVLEEKEEDTEEEKVEEEKEVEKQQS